MPLWYRLTPTPKLNNNGKIIVSLTSFPKRINKINLVIESILRQKIKPAKIFLYLSKEQFGDTICNSNLPKRLLALQKKGLNIIMVEEDIRSYKKFFYSFRDFPNNLILTIDDDIIYNKDLINILLKKKSSNNVTANLTRLIAKDKNGLLPYSQWQLDNDITKEHIVIGAGGVLYSPSSLHKDILNKELFISLAPKADDLWLSAMCILNNIKITSTNYPNAFVAISIKNNETLYSKNNTNNDIQLSLINDYYYNKIQRKPFD